MSDKKGNVSDKKGNIDMPALTERDLELLIGALRCIEGGFPKPDMQKFATMAGFKTPASANVSFNLLKRKVMGDSASAKPTPKKAIPAKRKQAATESGNGDGDEPDESATKKPKMAPKKAAKKKAEPQPEGGDDEGTAFI